MITIDNLTIEEKMQLYFTISTIFEGDYYPEGDEDWLEPYEEDENLFAKAIVSNTQFFKLYFENAKKFFYEESVYSTENGDEYSQYKSSHEALFQLYPREYNILKELNFFKL